MVTNRSRPQRCEGSGREGNTVWLDIAIDCDEEQIEAQASVICPVCDRPILTPRRFDEPDAFVVPDHIVG